ncbi:MAG: hypothetical protein MR598_03360 [Erysipelotrichaceae bacterium]|nr:hypothetical protein [Erysipelotrichaceae bacterium]
MNYNKIQSDFKNLEKSAESLINKYNKSVDSIKSQELAIEKVKDKIANLQLLADSGVIKDTEAGQLQNLNKQLDIMTSKLSQTKDEAKQTANKINDTFNEKRFNLGGISNGVSEISTKLDKFKKRVTRLIGTVAIFNLLRSSLTSLRDKFMTLLNTNDTFSSSLNQIKANLMTAFAPIYNACLPAINSLMSALSKLTGTIAVFVSGLFGKSLDDAKNQAKGLSKALDKTSKSGEKASGSLSSLDEIELINEDSSNVGGSGTEDTGINYDGEIQYSQKLLDFLNKIKVFVLDNKDLLIGLFAGILAGIAAFKIVNFIKNSEKLLKIFSGLKNASAGLIALGIGIAVAGIIFTIQSLISYLKDPSWDNFGKVITGIGIAVAGVALIFGAWPVAIGGALVAVLGLIISNWDKIKGTLQGGIDWLKTKGREIFLWLFGDVFAPLYDGFVNILQSALNFLDTTFNNAKKIFDNIIGFIKNVFTGNWKGAWENVKNIFLALLNQIKATFMLVLSTLGNLAVGVGQTVGNVIAGVFKAVVNGVLGAMESILNFPIKSVNKLIKVINEVPGINLGTLPTFNLPRLATGAVIPPRQEFAAILGDQKHGTNIEAPLDTIVDAFNISLNKRNDNNEVIDLLLELNRNIFELSKNPTILNINGREFAKATYNDFKNEDSRQQASTNIVRR